MDLMMNMLSPYTAAQELDPFGWPVQQQYGLRSTFPLTTQRRRMRTCDTDICEKKDGTFIVQCDLPGFDPKGENTFPTSLTSPYFPHFLPCL